MTIILDEVTPLESFVGYALLACALFQLVCIFAAVALPHSDKEMVDEMQNGSAEVSTGGHAGKSSQDHNQRRGKKEKKKHK